jgi:hypothetical protein
MFRNPPRKNGFSTIISWCANEVPKKARAAGFFKSAARIEELRKTKDLDVSQGRENYQALMLWLQPEVAP